MLQDENSTLIAIQKKENYLYSYLDQIANDPRGLIDKNTMVEIRAVSSKGEVSLGKMPFHTVKKRVNNYFILEAKAGHMVESPVYVVMVIIVLNRYKWVDKQC